MKALKKLFVVAVLVGIGWAAASAWQSPYFSLYQIDKGLTERDPVRVESYVDFQALVQAAADISAALAKEELGAGGDDLGSRLLGALMGAFASQVGEAAAVPGAAEMRRLIQEGKLQKSFGPFVVNEGWDALGTSQRFDKSALVELKGKCKEVETSLRVVFEERDGPTLGYPKRWVLVGVDKDSVKLLAKSCRTR